MKLRRTMPARWKPATLNVERFTAVRKPPERHEAMGRARLQLFSVAPKAATFAVSSCLRPSWASAALQALQRYFRCYEHSPRPTVRDGLGRRFSFRFRAHLLGLGANFQTSPGAVQPPSPLRIDQHRPWQTDHQATIRHRELALDAFLLRRREMRGR